MPSSSSSDEAAPRRGSRLLLVIILSAVAPPDEKLGRCRRSCGYDGGGDVDTRDMVRIVIYAIGYRQGLSSTGGEGHHHARHSLDRSASCLFFRFSFLRSFVSFQERSFYPESDRERERGEGEGS